MARHAKADCRLRPIVEGLPCRVWGGEILAGPLTHFGHAPLERGIGSYTAMP